MLTNSKALGSDLTEGSITCNLIRFSLPFLASYVLQTLYATVDAVVVGQFMGSAGLTAVNNASYITNAVSSIGMGASAGAGVLISQYAGAKKYDRLKTTIGTALSLSICTAVVLAILVCLLSDNIMHWINIPAEALIEARNYLVIRGIGVLFSFTYNTLGSVMRGMGDSKRPFYFVAVASVINVGLDLLFVAVFHWGAGGAALATVLSEMTTLICGIVYLRRREDFYFDFKPSSFKIHWPTGKILLKIGIPASMQFFFIDLSFVFVNSMINAYGLIASAAVAVGSKVVNLGEVGLSALSTGVGTMAGQNIGAGKTDRAAMTVKVGVRVSLIMMAIIFVIIQLFPEAFVRLFNSDAAALEESIRALRYLSLMYFPASFMFMYVCIAQAVGFTSFSMLCYILDGVVVRIAASLILTRVFNMGLTGIYLAMGLAPTLSAVISGVYFYSGRWKKRKLLDSKELQEEV